MKRGNTQVESRLAGARAPRVQVADIQRSRLLAAAVRACDELGYADTSVADIVKRSRVSRRTFYEMFSSREECFVAVLEQTVGLLEEELAQADVAGLQWRERMRAGLGVILSFFDREPALARVCVVHALAGGPTVLARREQIVARLAREVDRGRLEGAQHGGCTKLTAEGVVGAAFAIVHPRLLHEQREPLASLLGELTAMIVLPYLGSAAAQHEQSRPLPRAPQRRKRRVGQATATAKAAGDPLESVPMRVTYRTAKVLEGLLEHPHATNRQIAERAEILDQGQISKLIRRLERLGLVENHSGGHERGEPNAWQLTAKGEEVARSIRSHAYGLERRG